MTTGSNGIYDLYMKATSEYVGLTFAVARHPAVSSSPLSSVAFRVLGFSLYPSQYVTPVLSFVDGLNNSNSNFFVLSNVVDYPIVLDGIDVTIINKPSQLINVKVTGTLTLLPSSS